MRALGPRAWWLPESLDRRIPQIEHGDGHHSEPVTLDLLHDWLDGTVAFWERWAAMNTYDGPYRDLVDRRNPDLRGPVAAFGSVSLSDKLGPLALGKRDELVFLGREIGEQRNYSDEIAKTIDEEVRAIVDRAYDRATQVLEVHRDRLDALATKLIAEETVDKEAFEALFPNKPQDFVSVGGARWREQSIGVLVVLGLFLLGFVAWRIWKKASNSSRAIIRTTRIAKARCAPHACRRSAGWCRRAARVAPSTMRACRRCRKGARDRSGP